MRGIDVMLDDPPKQPSSMTAMQITKPSLLDGFIPLSSRSAIPFPRDRWVLEPLLYSVTDVSPHLPKHGQIRDGYASNTSRRVVVPPTKDLKHTSTNHDSPAVVKVKRRSTGGNAIPLGVRKLPPLLPRDKPDEDAVCLDEFDFDYTMATSSTKSSRKGDSTNRPSIAGPGAVRHDANHALKRMRDEEAEMGRVAENEPFVKRKKSKHSKRATEKPSLEISMKKTCTGLSNELKQIKLLNEKFGIDTSVVVTTVSDVLHGRVGVKSFHGDFMAVSTLSRDLVVQVEGVGDVDKHNALFTDLFGYCDEVKLPGHSAISNRFDQIAANLEPSVNLSFDLIFSKHVYLKQHKADLVWYAKRKLIHQKIVDLSDEVRARKREFMEAQGESVEHQIKLLQIHAKCRLECQDDLIQYEKFPGGPHSLSRYSRLSLNTISFTDFVSMNAELVIELDPSLLSNYEDLTSVQPSLLLKLYSLYELQVSSMLSINCAAGLERRHHGYVFLKDHPFLIRTDPFESSAEYLRRLRGQQSIRDDRHDYRGSMSDSCAADLGQSRISNRQRNRVVLRLAGIDYSTLKDYAINCGLAKGDAVATHVARIMAELVATTSMNSTLTVGKEERSTKELAVTSVTVTTGQHQRTVVVKLIDSVDERTVDSLKGGERCTKGIFTKLSRSSYTTRHHNLFDTKSFHNTFRKHCHQHVSDMLGFDPDWVPSFIVRALPVAPVGHDDPINTGPICLYMAVYSAVGIKVFAVDRSVWGATLRSLLKFKTKFSEKYPERRELIETEINLFFNHLSNSKLGLYNSERIDNAKCNIVIYGLKRLIAQLKLKRNEQTILFDRVDNNLSRYVMRDSLIRYVNAVINNAISGADVDKLGLEQSHFIISAILEHTKFAHCLALILGRVIELNKLILSAFDQFIDSIPFADGCFDYNHYLYFHEEPLSIGTKPSVARIMASAENRWRKLSTGRADCNYYFEQFLGEKRLSAFETTNQYCERIKLKLPESSIASEITMSRVRCGIVAVIEEVASDGSVCIKEKIKVNFNLKSRNVMNVTELSGPSRQVDHVPSVRCGDTTAHFPIWCRPNIGLANGIYLLCSWIQRIFRIRGSDISLMAVGRERHGHGPGLKSSMIEFCDQFYAELLHSWTIDEIVGLKSEWFPYFTEQTFTFGIPNNNSSLFAVERQQQFALVQFRFLGFTAKAWDLSQNWNVVYLRCIINFLKQVAEFKNNQFETDLCIESIEMLKSCFSNLIVLKSDLMNKLILLHFGGEVVPDKLYRFALKSFFVPQFIPRMECLTAATDFVIKYGRSFDSSNHYSKFL